MSECQKANHRKRLKSVDSVIEAVRLSGVSIKALVRPLSAHTAGAWAIQPAPRVRAPRRRVPCPELTPSV